MVNTFDHLMQIWQKITDEHLEYHNKSKTLSILEVHQHIVKVAGQIIEFDEFSKDLNADYPAGESTLLAAKFKNKYELYRYLSTVLFDLIHRLLNEIEKMEPKKPQLDSEIKAEIAHQVRLHVAKALRKTNDAKRTKKSL
jgi:hypothetical protein